MKLIFGTIVFFMLAPISFGQYALPMIKGASDEFNQDVIAANHNRTPQLNMNMPLSHGMIGKPFYEVDTLPKFKVKQVVDDSNALVAWGDQLYWYSGPSSEFIDDKFVTIPGMVEVCKPRRYETRLGSNTVPELRTYTMTPELSKFQTSAKETPLKPSKYRFQVFELKNRTKVFGRYVSYADGELVVQLRDGKTESTIKQSELGSKGRSMASKMRRTFKEKDALK